MSTITKQVDFYCCLVASTKGSTLSRLWQRSTFADGSKADSGVCWILEDAIREIGEDGSGKIWGKTAIPEGSYAMEPVFAPSKFAIKGKELWDHDFALGLRGVPHFDLVRCHWGIKVDDTLGCPLTGMDALIDPSTSNFMLSRSRDAYATRLHPRVAVHYDKSTRKFRIPITWHVLRNGLLDVNLFAKEAWT